MKKILKIVLLLFLFYCIKPVKTFAFFCNYQNSNEKISLEVAGNGIGHYYFKDLTYGFTSKSNLPNGECPQSVIKMPNGIYCALGYYASPTEKGAVCNNSLTLGTKYTLTGDSNAKNKNDSLITNSPNVAIYVENKLTNITGKLINSKTYVSLDQLCSVLNCKYGYKSVNQNKAKEILTITMNLENYSKEFSTFFFEIEYDLKEKSYRSYLNVGNNENNVNRFKLRDLDASASILYGNSSTFPTLGKSNESSSDLYVPIRVISNGLGKNVKWDQATKSVYISNPPMDYSHGFTSYGSIKSNKIIPRSNIVNGKIIEIPKGECLNTLALSENDEVLDYTTALAFLSQDTTGRKNSKYKFVTKRFKNADNSYIGITDSICATGQEGDTDDVLVISVKNYFPSVSKYRAVIGKPSEYKAESKGTIINVPIDSRPVTRGNFEPLVRAAGFSYYEVNSGLDSYNTSWNSGNVNVVQQQLNSLLESHKNENPIVILNLSSYMFGGLVGTRNSYLYNTEHVNSSLNKIGDLIKQYPQAQFYINFVIPRTQPDPRAYGNKNNWSQVNYHGIQYYLDGKTKVNYQQALLEWSYLYYMKQALNGESIPSKVQQFYTDFYNLYKSDCDNYLKMYEEVSNIMIPGKYKNNLFQLQASNNVQVTIGVDDYELPRSIENNLKSEKWIPKSNGEIIKYTGSNVSYEKAKAYYGPTLKDIYAVDEVNHIVLAHAINKITGSTIKVNTSYSDPELKVPVSQFSKNSIGEIIPNAVSFINSQSSNSGKVNLIDAYFVGNSGDISSFSSNVFNSVNGHLNTMVIDLSTDVAVSQKLYNVLLPKAFSMASYGGWNTNGNAIGIQLARNTVYADLVNDVEECIASKVCTTSSVTKELKDRIVAYDKTRVIGVLEDIVYNHMGKNINTYQSGIYYKNAIEQFKNTKFDIGGYQYQYHNIDVRVSRPWNRAFEIGLSVTIS